MDNCVIDLKKLIHKKRHSKQYLDCCNSKVYMNKEKP